VIYIKDNYDTEKYIKEHESYIEAKGGDGTLLKAINKLSYLGKPFFGVAAGTENFLMNSEGEILENHSIVKFNTIQVEVEFEIFNEERKEILYAFNDVMIGGDMNSWIEFNVKEKDDFFGSFKGGGLIISTPQGSTGINYNNSGVILPLDSNLWSITGDKTNRKIEYVLKPRKTTIEVQSRRDVYLWVDGSNHIFRGVKKVTLKKGKQVEVIFNNYSEFKRKRRKL